MSTGQHTPGPWYALSGGYVSTTVGPDWPSHVVADCNIGSLVQRSEYQKTADANARLIAQAPDLLALCREAREVLGACANFLSDWNEGAEHRAGWLHDDDSDFEQDCYALLAKLDAALGDS